MSKFLSAGILLLLYIFVLFCVYFVHIRFFSVDVVFYAALLDVFVACILMAAIVFFIRSKFVFFEKFLLVVIFFLIGYSLSISVPTVIDRSLSFYILEKLQQRGGGIRFDRLGDVFVREYLVEHRLVDVRVTEQVKSGNIEVGGECVRLTSQGRALASASRYFRQHFLPKNRLLMNEYTDVLTDPFRNSTSEYDYGCD